MANKHDCIEKLSKEIMGENKSIKYVRVKLSTIREISDTDKEFKTGQALEVGYEKKKRNGSLHIVENKEFITHTFCPFCGKKYDQ